MFERYTERARRVLFFARYEASQFGTQVMETEHLLLGLLRESKGLTTRLLQPGQKTPEQMRDELTSRMPLFHEPLATSVEIPFGKDLKRTLMLAVEESDQLGHSYIGTEHLLLALLRDQHTVAGSVLASAGLEYGAVRTHLIELLKHAASEVRTDPMTVTLDLSQFIDRMKGLVDQLAQMPTGSAEARALVEQMHRELDNLGPSFTALLRPPPPH